MMSENDSIENRLQEEPADARHAAMIEAARRQVLGAPGSEPSSAKWVVSADASGPPPESFAGYRILRQIHRGGQGVVYQAIQGSTNRVVAIKIMRESGFAGRFDRFRFEREVQILSQFSHPNIVTIHDSGVVSGCPFLVMKYIEGEPLDIFVHSKPRPLREVLVLFQVICEAVNAAHLRGIIHRDLKPANIRVDGEGNPHILDFGLAKLSGPTAQFQGWQDGDLNTMTQTGQFVGSLPWSSPEQADGVGELIDFRTDVYSLGVILFQMLTGSFPYDVRGPMRQVVDRIVRCEPSKPRAHRPEIDDDLQTIVLTCLKKDRERRYQSAGELARDVKGYLNGAPIEAKRDHSWYVAGKLVRRHRFALCVIAAFVLLLAAFGFVNFRNYRHTREMLWRSSLAEARALRVSTGLGRRWEGLEAIRTAASIRPSFELRNEAISLLGISDARRVQSWPFPAIETTVLDVDRTLETFAISHRDDGSISLHHMTDGQAHSILSPVGGSLQVGRFSPSGRYFAAKREDYTVANAELALIVWDARTGEVILSVPDGAVHNALDFAPDDRLISGSPNGQVTVHNLKTHQSGAIMMACATPFRLRASPDNRRLAICCREPVIEVFDMESGALLIFDLLTEPCRIGRYSYV